MKKMHEAEICRGKVAMATLRAGVILKEDEEEGENRYLPVSYFGRQEVC